MPPRARALSVRRGICLSVLVATVCLVSLAGPSPTRAEPLPEPATAAVSTPALVALLGAEKPEAVLGEDERIDLVLDFEGPEASVVTLGRIAVSVGQIVDVERIGPSTYVATYLPPPSAFPQVALAIIEWRPPAGPSRFLLWRCPLRARTDFPFRTASRASVTLTIGEETFGPVRADHEGRVTLPLEVLPGYSTGVARAVDRYGNATETAVELTPPPFVRSVILAPESLEAGAESPIAVAAVDAHGQLLGPASFTLLARGEKVPPPPSSEPGIGSFSYVAPTNVQQGPVDLRVALPDATEEGGPAIMLRPGRPASLHVVPDRQRLSVGQGATASVAVFSRDALGNLSALEGLEVAIDGIPRNPVVDGRVATFLLPSPRRVEHHDRILVDAALGPLRAHVPILLQGDKAERLAVTVERDRLSQQAPSVRLFVRVTDRLGAPAPARTTQVESKVKGGRIGAWNPLGESAWTTELTADQAHHPLTTHLSVRVSPDLVAHVHLPVDPGPERGALSLRAGLMTNFGALLAPYLAAEWTTTARWLGPKWRAGLELTFVAFRFDDGPYNSVFNAPVPTADLFQVPLLGKVVRRIPLRWGLELGLGAAAGLELAILRTRATSAGASSSSVVGSALAPVAAGAAELGLFVLGGEMYAGARYFLTRVGRVSSGDEIDGNPLGLGLDVGYRLRW